MVGQLKDSRIRLKKLYVEAKLPDALQPLRELAQNLWWSWNFDAIELFQSVDPDNWIEANYNPIAILDNLSVERAGQLIKDKSFMSNLKKVHKAYTAYINELPNKKDPQIAYFCMEYGLHISMRLYSGGLGILAGDFLKEASDMNVNMIGVGLLYRYGYFQQSLSLHGDQIANYPAQKFTQLPLNPVKNQDGEWIKISIQYPGRLVFAKLWELKVGRISLYLMDTDIEENSWEDRTLTHNLYGGHNEHRLKQEILLGIGGVKALNAMGITPDLYHSNEGHAAFFGLERLKNLIQEDNLNYSEALEVVRSSSLFTTHTPVPAGHDYFHESLLKEYIFDYASSLRLSWKELITLGKIDPDNIHENFSMSHLAARLCQEINGVSQLHGTVSQKMFNGLYPDFHFEELHIGYVTNSVHYPTWIAKEWLELHQKTFGKAFLKDQPNKGHWRKIREVSDKTIMDIRKTLKGKLVSHIKEQLKLDLRKRGESPGSIFKIVNSIPENALMIGFARRFATYKRAHLLFRNLERLAKIVNQENRPVVFVFSGKAHPADNGGQGLIRQIINITKQEEFLGKVIFLENYNIESAKLLVQGVDIWLNTPTRPKEASGTSGMKAALNGVMNLSVLDGWWAEGYRPDAGWALPLERTYSEQHLQDELDAETIYSTLENDIIPVYYDFDKNGVSAKWVAYIKNIIAEVAPDFTMTRMMQDYLDRFYNKLAGRSKKLNAQNFRQAKTLTIWKEAVMDNWDQIQVIDTKIMDTTNQSLSLGDPFKASITLSLGNLSKNDIAVEVIFFKRISENDLEFIEKVPLKAGSEKDGKVTFKCSVNTSQSGVYEYGFRILPQNRLLPHPMDFELVKWT